MEQELTVDVCRHSLPPYNTIILLPGGIVVISMIPGGVVVTSIILTTIYVVVGWGVVAVAGCRVLDGAGVGFFLL